MVSGISKFEYTITAFADLRSAYTTWNDLRAFLISVEGGSLRVIDNGATAIITYQQTIEANRKMVKVIPEPSLFEKLPWLRWCQWTTWDTVANLPLSVAPQRSQLLTDSQKNAQMSEIMVGHFVCPYQEGRVETTFELCEGEKPVYDPRKYHSLYKHTLCTGGEFSVVSRIKEKQRIVLLEATVGIDGVIQATTYVNTVDFDSEDELATELMPMTDSFITFYSKFLAQQTLLYPGWILHDGLGGQRIMLAGFYEQARAMRLISNYAPYRLIELRRRNDLDDYLQIFPEEVDVYETLKTKIDEVAVELLNYYLGRWQKKSMSWADIPKQYHKHIAAVNNIYHIDLKPNHMVVEKTNVLSYINELPAAQLVFLVNRVGLAFTK